MEEGLGFQTLPLTMSMVGRIRILLLDLLVERAEFGHGGNQEVIRPFLKNVDVEVLLLTPQMQSFESGNKTDTTPTASKTTMLKIKNYLLGMPVCDLFVI